jgi:hypothetical protein
MSTQSEAPRDYLSATGLCDCKNLWLRAKAKEIGDGAGTPEEKALRVFSHVRDGVRFGLAYSRSKASRTLKRGYGECGNKTNAQVALLRAAGIPARFRWVLAKTEILRHLIADFVFKNMPAIASHFWCECCLNGKWISCESLLDKPLYDGMLREGLVTKEQVPTIDWDGKTDFVLLKPWIAEDRGHLPSFDDALRRLKSGDEGMPPLWVERIIAPIFYPLDLRNSDRIRRLGQR